MLNKRLIVAVVLLVISLSLLAYRFLPTSRPQRQTPAQQQAAILSQYPAGPDMGAGRNIRMAGRTLDVMYDTVSDRMSREAKECARLHVSKPERARRIRAVYAAGRAEIRRVLASGYRASGYNARFNPDYTVNY